MEDEPILDFGSAFDSPTFAKDGSFEVDRPVGSMSISPCGRDVVLASRQGLHIIDLDSPWATPRHLPHHTPWEVADVQWSPFPSRDFWVVSTSNQKALVWNLAMPTPGTSVEHVLHAHSRAITDINFSAHHPDVLATCAVDSFVHCWDLRYPAKPALTFCDWFAGATQVKWNRQDAHIIASSHDKILRIWDDRKGAHPLRSIEAHDTKIYGVDWNRTQAHRVATCSLDKTIKFWDYTSAQDVPERIIATPFPVWRARHTPFGCGMLAMPQRGDHDLHMYDRRMGANMESIEDVSPVHRFQGHQDQVKEFLWRSRGAVNAGIDDREFQLVSWGADRVLRLHYVDQNLLKEVGYEKGKEVDEKLNLTRKNALYKTYREDAVSHSDSDTVQSSIIGAHFSAEMGVETDVHGIKGESMSAGPLPSAGAWVDGDFLTSRPGMRNRIATRVDIDPISWMKGVKIGKRDGQLEQSFASVSSPNFKADGNWIDFESLGEEITHVGALFRKADFHEINVKDRFVKVALYGPWGPSDSSTYLDCRLAFPTNYPNNATIAFSVEKTATVDAGIASRLGTDVEKIGSAYLAVGRGSLEAVIRYLHGEQTLEELITWATGEQGDTISVFPNDGDSSSSDEDDTLGAFLGDQNDDQEHATGVLSSSNANANVPLPKACGALWADDGRLICFFPPKEEKPQTLLGSLGLQGNDLLARKGKKAFDGFGDFQIRAPITKTKLSSVETTTSEDLDSDFDSDTSYSSSSRSSNSSEDMEISRQRLDHPYIYTGDTIQRSIAIDGSQLSSGILSLSRSGAPNAKTILSIHNLEDLLPAKSSLAKEYLLRGPSASKHNADIASRQGLSVLADVWHLLDILTRNEVPLDAIVDAQKHLSFLLPTPSSISSLTRGDSAIDLSFDAKLRDDHQGFMAAVSWGQHPMGNGYLINALFTHFERLADIQMLATMASILSQYPTMSDTHDLLYTMNRSQRQGVAPSTYSTLPSSPSFQPSAQRRYFPSREVAQSLLQGPTSPWSLRKTATLSVDPPSIPSSFGASDSDPVTSLSSGMIPPSSYMPGRASFNRSDLTNQVFSTSPEQFRNPPRSNSNLASAFAGSFQRPFGLSVSASSSPPNSHPKRRNSPAGSYAGGPQPSVTWAASNLFGRSWSNTEEAKSTKTTSESLKAHYRLDNKHQNMVICLKNQDLFDNEGYSDVPLVDHSLEVRFQGYIEAYAHLLFTWGLPVTRTELLQNSSKLTTRKASSETASMQEDISAISLGRKTSEVSAAMEGKPSLDIRVSCPGCNDTLPLATKTFGSKHHSCRFKAVSLCCNLCDELIRGRATPCLGCGHVLHAACMALLASKIESGNQSTKCISGCDCHCRVDAVVVMSWPEERPTLASSASTIREGEVSNGVVWEGQPKVWEDVAYESLAKNLGVAGGKYVKPKSSQIWRGREKRGISTTK